jgi:signal transduction histidine kinase
MTDRLERQERRRLGWRLALFLLAVAVPSGLLLLKALDQLKWESLRRTQLAAETLTLAIDQRLDALIREQDRRSFAEFSFLTVAGDPAAGFVQRSPLAAYPVEPAVPGLIGWFQIDAAGVLSTPVLPPAGSDAGAYGIDTAELAGRQRLEQRIGSLLSRNALADDARRAVHDPVAAADSGAPAAELRAAEAMSATALRPYAPAKSVAEGQALFERLFSRRQTEAQDAELLDERADAGLSTRGQGGPREPRSAGEVAPARGTAPAPAAPGSAPAAGGRTRAPRREQAALPEPPPVAEGTEVAAVAAQRSPPSPEPAAAMAARSGAAAGRAGFDAPMAAGPGGRPHIAAPASPRQPSASAPALARPVIRTFESELGPFRFDRLDSGHLVLYRWAWRDGARFVQGALLEAAPFLVALVGAPFAASALDRAAALHVSWRGGGADSRPELLATYAARAAGGYERAAGGRLPAGTVVHRARLTEPFGALSLRFDAARLPRPPGAVVIYWLGAALALVLLAGGWMLYRLGLRQLALSRQQRDFVAAVSHELKTPLTAIRMYSEMLREGWAAEDKRPGYYRYIHDEAERLSRLVANVLQLARMSRDDLRVEPRAVALSALLEQARPTLSNLAGQAGFELMIDCDHDARVNADPDAVTQVLINLVDNGIKFTGQDAPAAQRRIRIRCGPVANRRSGGVAVVTVRDHGPGIPGHQRRLALALFQRLENEATRETKGTGIGLALVDRLMRAMGGRIELHDGAPGLEVRLHFRAA